MKSGIKSYLFTKVDNSPLIVFRIFFGLLIFLECAGAIALGWVKETFVDVTYPITFIGFDWLQPLPGYGMYFYYGIMAALGIMVLIGLYYKISLGIFSFMWWGSYLMQKTHYNNHYYFIILLSFFMLIVPAHRYLSMDVKRNTSLKSFVCPRWCLLIFVLQVAIVFIYASIAKIYPGWLEGKTMDIWFVSFKQYPIVGPLFETEWMKWFLVYGGIIFDLLIVPLLLWKRTRNLGFGLCVFFNLFNSFIFQIGIFPYTMIALTIFFFPPEEIRKIFFKQRPVINEELERTEEAYSWKHLLITISVLIFFTIQLLMPLRHWLYEGDVHWTEEGHRMSWRMMLRTKHAYINFEGRDPKTGKRFLIDLNEYFTSHQLKEIGKRPDMVWQAAQILKEIYLKKGINQLEIYAQSRVSLNGDPYRPMIDPNVDLLNVEWEHFSHSKWILP